MLFGCGLLRAETSPTAMHAYIPISQCAVGILKNLSTCAALYLAFLVLVNLEVLVLLLLVIKQKAYSGLYKELGMPVVGPVFLTQWSGFKLVQDSTDVC